MSGGTVVVLTNGEQNLAHYMDLLRREGYRVLATARPYEALLFVARHRARCVILRKELLPTPSGGLIDEIRSLTPTPFILVVGEPFEQGSATRGDLHLPEPFRYSSLLEVLAVAGDQGPPDVAVAAQEVTPAAPEPAVTPEGRVLKETPRLLACARRLTELEKDRDQLLTTALEMFQECVGAERGSLMLRKEGTRTLELIRRRGFPPDAPHPPPLELGATPAGRVALTGEPVLVSKVEGPMVRGYRGRAYIIVPLHGRASVRGVVNLTDPLGEGSFAEEDLRLASLLAEQVSINLANADHWEELHRMAVVDPLTGLFNRRFFERQIAVELERARRYDRQLTLALLDIDSFKKINDQTGYTTGDTVIRLVADVIRQSFREVDVVTRWGGDEFAVLLPETGKPRFPEPGDAPSLNYVERVRQAVERTDFKMDVESLSSPITVSAGVATFPVDAKDKDELFSVANRALKRAKRSGHNRVCLAGEDPPGT